MKINLYFVISQRKGISFKNTREDRLSHKEMTIKLKADF